MQPAACSAVLKAELHCNQLLSSLCLSLPPFLPCRTQLTIHMQYLFLLNEINPILQYMYSIPVATS